VRLVVLVDIVLLVQLNARIVERILVLFRIVLRRRRLRGLRRRWGLTA